MKKEAEKLYDLTSIILSRMNTLQLDFYCTGEMCLEHGAEGTFSLSEDC